MSGICWEGWLLQHLQQCVMYATKRSVSRLIRSVLENNQAHA